MLARALMRRAAARPRNLQQEWSKLMLSMLHDIHQESAIYLMVEASAAAFYSVSAAARERRRREPATGGNARRSQGSGW